MSTLNEVLRTSSCQRSRSAEYCFQDVLPWDGQHMDEQQYNDVRCPCSGSVGVALGQPHDGEDERKARDRQDGIGRRDKEEQ